MGRQENNHGGTWENGTWKNGAWVDGTWENGTWKNGAWYNGEWNEGTWESGRIWSRKFNKSITSVKAPNIFYEIEKTCDNIEELKAKSRLKIMNIIKQ